ncbi:MAG: hypothetical protein EOO77_39815, partial [Oxalobacteraceae bacterium]
GNATWFGNLEFVPQLWGGDDAASFQAAVLANVPATQNILTFNEPDSAGDGQATMTPALAATIWKKYVDPLADHGIRLGSPATTGTDSGIQWLKEFYGNCTDCQIDFIATHWYGSFQGLAAHLGNLYNVFNGTKMWVTELGIDFATIEDSNSMFNQTIPWLDNLEWVERYAWFGSFRSSESNIGPNATFMDANGDLTSMGKTYLYQVKTASNATTSSSTTRRSTTRSTATATSSTSGAMSLASQRMGSEVMWFGVVSFASLVLAVVF